jgi:uncharacterized SAM-binding protein YcdF (DUF218 family)
MIVVVMIVLGAFPALYGMIRLRISNSTLALAESAILVLGGSDGSRERHAFALAKEFDRMTDSELRAPTLDVPLPDTNPAMQLTHTKRNPIRIWISTGRPRPEIARISKQMGIESSRIELDYRAIDTVTNFTTVAAKLSAAKISKVYVVTDITHIDRAMIIANIVLPYYGIKPVAAPSPNTMQRENEWKIRGWRDYLRCVIWFYTGKSGAHLMALRNWRKLIRKFIP